LAKKKSNFNQITEARGALQWAKGHLQVSTFNISGGGSSWGGIEGFREPIKNLPATQKCLECTANAEEVAILRQWDLKDPRHPPGMRVGAKLSMTT